MGAFQAGAWLKVADASVGAALKSAAGGGVGGAGPEGPGVIIGMTIGVRFLEGRTHVRSRSTVATILTR